MSEKVAWFRTRGGQSGPTRRALDLALKDRDLAGSAQVTAELARGAAELVDSARRAQDARLWLSASQRLLSLVGRLGLDDVAVPDDGDDGAGDPDDDAAGLDAVLGSGPSVGDEPES